MRAKVVEGQINTVHFTITVQLLLHPGQKTNGTVEKEVLMEI